MYNIMYNFVLFNSAPSKIIINKTLLLLIITVTPKPTQGLH